VVNKKSKGGVLSLEHIEKAKALLTCDLPNTEAITLPPLGGYIKEGDTLSSELEALYGPYRQDVG
jgi:hypothetical protein